MESRIIHLNSMLTEANNIVFFTGAGISTGAGIPDFRSATGLYQNLASGMLPAAHVPDLLIKLLQLNPYSDDPIAYIKSNIVINSETQPIIDYFGVEK